VNETARPDRADRSGGRWSTPGLLDDVLRLAAVERAVAHLITGWVVKVGDLDEKLALVASLEGHLDRAVAMRNHAVALLERDEAGLTAHRSWVEPLRALDASGDPSAVIAAVGGDIPAFLRDGYARLADGTDPLFDARLLASVRKGLTDLGEPGRDFETGRLHADLEQAAADAEPLPVHLDELLWAPIDRVPFPARPAGRPRPVAGTRGHFAWHSRRLDTEIAGELNDNVMAELCAMELLSRCSYEHPDEAWAFHLSLSRHVVDEQRHAAMFRRLLVERGVDESTLVQHGANYEWAYEFPECEVGGKRELTWRILIMCTVLEALAIDKLPVEIATRDWLDQPDIARALDYIAADELFHTENGLRLTRQLCERYEFDPILERERVHGRFFGRQRDERLRYLAEDPERAAIEIALSDGPDPDLVPFKARTEVELRRRSGFTDDECLQVDRWGYNEPLDPHAHDHSVGHPEETSR
jgi:hypothetical protein